MKRLPSSCSCILELLNNNARVETGEKMDFYSSMTRLFRQTKIVSEQTMGEKIKLHNGVLTYLFQISMALANSRESEKNDSII